MRRLLAALIVTAGLASAAPAHAALCSPLKTNCVWINAVYGTSNSFVLHIQTYESIGWYGICVTDPTNAQTCSSLRLYRGSYAGAPSTGSARYTGKWIGNYRAIWYRPDGSRLAPFWWWPRGPSPSTSRGVAGPSERA